MISQMNIVQNAARMAMDHRAARPGRRATSAKSTTGLFGVGVALCVALLALLIYGIS